MDCTYGVLSLRVTEGQGSRLRARVSLEEPPRRDGSEFLLGTCSLKGHRKAIFSLTFIGPACRQAGGRSGSVYVAAVVSIPRPGGVGNEEHPSFPTLPA